MFVSLNIEPAFLQGFCTSTREENHDKTLYLYDIQGSFLVKLSFMWEPTKAPIDPTDISKVWSPVQIDTPGTYRICHLDE